MSKYRLMDATELQADLDENKRQVPRTKPLDDEAATIRFYLDLETQAAAHHPEEAPPPPEPSSGGLPSKSPESRPKPPELPKETPMSKKPRGTKLSKSMDPEERLDALLVRLQQQLKNKLVKNAYSTKVAIRKVCDEHGLAVPAEALPKVEGETPAPKKPGRKKAEPEQPLKVGRRKREVAPPPADRGGFRAAA